MPLSAAPDPEELTGPPEGLVWPEAPRWHDGRLWFVDLFTGRVLTAAPGEVAQVVAQVDDDVSGLGFLPDGTPLVVSMRRRRVLRLERGGATALHADLSALAPGYLNDMVVGPTGRAYVDAIRSTQRPADGRPEDALLVVEPGGEARVAVAEAARPNGLVLDDDGTTLLQASTTGCELVAWSVDARGDLHAPRVWASTGEHTPDGICADAQGGVWVATLGSRCFLRVTEGGVVTDRIDVAPRWAVACVLGGEDRRTLFLLTAEPGELPVQAHPRTHRGHVLARRVTVPGAGRP
ncbi:SMP-30/gluconolactonase/LRE family protein [Baekduia soli]|uniref:SMP-30/gluconolactonase/LRE family protein n=1 Tax=Baekduia soli TaxID=496014 RepID=UPI0016527184|nr:SMP-30/gluconolactonase/LRE family protein [Baekduia soli]